MDQPPGRFIGPDPSLALAEDPLALIGQDVLTRYRAIDHLGVFAGRNPLVDALLRREAAPPRYEDQCSPRYYLDIAEAVCALPRQVGRIIDVGVFLGGTSELFAAGLDHLDCGLDLVDVDARYLRFSHERIRRGFPAVIGRVRLFHGTLPQYVASVLTAEAETGLFVHHDASHTFGQVVRDLSALSFVRDRIARLAIQDTNLRGRIAYENFVDAALWAVFGRDVAFDPLGAVFDHNSPEMLEPNRFEGNYVLPGVPEGMLLDLSRNTFRYPHPLMVLDEFL